MDSNGSYSFDQNALQQQAFTDLFATGENFGSESLPDGPLDPTFGLSGLQAVNQTAMQQPASVDGSGVGYDNPHLFNQAAQSLNGTFPGLNNYQSFDQIGHQGTNANDLWPEVVGLGAPYSFDQTTLPQGPVTDMFALNATANNHALNGSHLMDQNALDTAAFGTGLDLDAPFEFNESE